MDEMNPGPGESVKLLTTNEHESTRIRTGPYANFANSHEWISSIGTMAILLTQPLATCSGGGCWMIIRKRFWNLSVDLRPMPNASSICLPCGGRRGLFVRVA